MEIITTALCIFILSFLIALIVTISLSYKNYETYSEKNHDESIMTKTKTTVIVHDPNTNITKTTITENILEK